MTDADHGMTTIKVQVLLTFVVPHFTAFTFDDVDIKQWIYVEEFHHLFVFLLLLNRCKVTAIC